MRSGAAAVDGSAVAAPWRPSAARPRLPLETREGFRAFYNDALPQVYAHLMRRCGGDRALAEDLTQEAFLAAARQIRDGRADAVSIPWLITVAQNKHVDHVRRALRDERNLAVAWHVGEHDELQRWRLHRDREHALEMLEDLPPAQRAALQLFYFEDLTVAQTAARLARSVRATESLLARGRDALRRRMAEEARDG